MVIADMARSKPPMVSWFVGAELTRRLQGQGTDLALPLTWIEQRLAEGGWTIKKSWCSRKTNNRPPIGYP